MQKCRFKCGTEGEWKHCSYYTYRDTSFTKSILIAPSTLMLIEVYYPGKEHMFIMCLLLIHLVVCGICQKLIKCSAVLPYYDHRPTSVPFQHSPAVVQFSSWSLKTAGLCSINRGTVRALRKSRCMMMQVCVNGNHARGYGCPF